MLLSRVVAVAEVALETTQRTVETAAARPVWLVFGAALDTTGAVVAVEGKTREATAEKAATMGGPEELLASLALSAQAATAAEARLAEEGAVVAAAATMVAAVPVPDRALIAARAAAVAAAVVPRSSNQARRTSRTSAEKRLPVTAR